MMKPIKIDRRNFLISSAGGATTLAIAGMLGDIQQATAQADNLRAKIQNGIAWYNVEDWGVEGKGWTETARYFDRLPAKAEKSVRDAVWNLSRHSAGMLTQFATNSPSIHVRYKLLSANLAMPHMPATGVSGIDLYAENETGQLRWLQVVKPGSQEITTQIVSGIDPLSDNANRKYAAYLPLYNGVDSLEIGVEEKSAFAPIAPRSDKPMVFYGTSIMHGACGSRPGMSITAILGRRLNRPTINLGFSGNGRMEKEVGDLLCELDPCVYAIDCLPNMDADLVGQNTEPLVRQLREKHAETPILLVEDRSFTNATFLKSLRDRHAGSRAALRAAFERLQKEGVQNLFYLPGDDLLGHDGEAATDGSHPSDLGMVRYADAYEPVLKKIFAA